MRIFILVYFSIFSIETRSDLEFFAFFFFFLLDRSIRIFLLKYILYTEGGFRIDSSLFLAFFFFVENFYHLFNIFGLFIWFREYPSYHIFEK